MKNWCLLLFVLLIAGCSGDEKEQQYKEIKIEKMYPYFYEKRVLDDTDEETLTVFNRNIYSVNSTADLNKNPLFDYLPAGLKEEFRRCDFDKYTLIIASSSEIQEVVEVKSRFVYDVFFPEYMYHQYLQCKPLVEPVESIYLMMNAFLVKKISTGSKVLFTTSITLKQ